MQQMTENEAAALKIYNPNRQYPNGVKEWIDQIAFERRTRALKSYLLLTTALARA